MDLGLTPIQGGLISRLCLNYICKCSISKRLQTQTSSWDLDISFGEHRASLMAQMVKKLPAKQETRVQSRKKDQSSQKDPLEKGMPTHSGILARRSPWTDEPERLESMVSQRVRHDRAMKQQQFSLWDFLLLKTWYVCSCLIPYCLDYRSFIGKLEIKCSNFILLSKSRLASTHALLFHT